VKAILVSSLFALMALSSVGANAAGFPENEPAHTHVRVCDPYGIGFVYVPGTETCMRISGYIQSDFGLGEKGKPFSGVHWIGNDGRWNDTYWTRMRASLRVDARSETELGTLRSFVEVLFNHGNSATSATYDPATDSWSGAEYSYKHSQILNKAFIELGGFTLGRTDSVFASWTNFGGLVFFDTGYFGGTVLGYGDIKTNLISYTHDFGGGLSAVLSLEQGTGASLIDDYLPNVVGGIRYKSGPGTFSMVAAYDRVPNQWLAKVRYDLTLGDRFTVFGMAAYKSHDDGDPTQRTAYGPWGGHWAVWGGLTKGIGEKTDLNAQIAYDGSRTFLVSANLRHDLARDFFISPELAYMRSRADGGSWGLNIRLRRSF
jgi:hypothetical protein